MKKTAFIFGYAGSILALIFALFMIFTVPLNIITDSFEDIKSDMENENVLALNEVAIAMMQEGSPDYSEQAVEVFAQKVAKNSEIINDEDIYEDSIEIFYDLGWKSAISMVLVGLAVIFALVSFIGALICRKAPTGGGVMMLVAALVMLLTAIYTQTLIPMLFACMLLTIAGIAAFIKIPQNTGKKQGNVQYAQAYSAPVYTPSLNEQVQYQSPPAQPEAKQADIQEINEKEQESVPFPEEQTAPEKAEQVENTKMDKQKTKIENRGSVPFPEQETDTPAKPDKQGKKEKKKK